MDLHNIVLNKLEEQIKTGCITKEEAHELQMQLALLAFTMINCGELHVVSKQQAAVWLGQTHHRRDHADQWMEQALVKAEHLWQLSTAAGLLTTNGDQLQFANHPLQIYFSAYYYSTQELDSPLLTLTTTNSIANPSLQAMWVEWSKLNVTLVDGLIRLLAGSPDMDVREAAAIALGYIQDPRAVEPFIEVLQTEDNILRWWAIDGLSKIGDPRAVPPLLELLWADDCTFDEDTAKALGVFGPGITDALLEALQHEQAQVRARAAETLGYTQDPQAVESLIAALADQSHSVRQMAAWALGELGDKRALGALSNTLLDEYSTVRYTAACALGRLAVPPLEAPLLRALAEDPNGDVRWAAARSLSQFGNSQMVAPLIAALHDPVSDVRYWSAVALGNSNDVRAIPALTHVLENDLGETRLPINGLTARVVDAARIALERIEKNSQNPSN